MAVARNSAGEKEKAKGRKRLLGALGSATQIVPITSISGSKSLMCFTNRIFGFSGPPGLRLAFDAVEKNGKFGRIQCQRSKEGSSRGNRKRRVFLCRNTVRVEVKKHRRCVRGAMEKSRYVRIIEGKKVSGDGPNEYFLPTEFRSIF